MKTLLTGLCLALGLAACTSSPAVTPSKPTAPVASAAPAAPPPCPEAVLPGGDPLDAPAFEGKPVVRVCVVGGSESSREAAQHAIELHPNDVFTAARMRADLQALLKLGTFDDVAGFGLRVRDGTSVVLLYSVHERPLVSQIGFEGAKLLGDAALDAKLTIAKESPYDPAKASAAALAVRNEYRLRGYEAARVVVVTEPVPGTPEHVRVHLKVDEGPLSRFTKIEFKGNKKVPEADLRKAAGLEVGKPVVSEAIEHAALLLSALYYDRGFVQVRVDTEVGQNAQGGVPVAFVIDEGDVYSVGKLRVTKVGAPFEKELLEKVVRMRSKQVFVRSAVMQDLERVSTFFADRAQRVSVTPLTEIDPKKHTIDLTFEIDKAP